MSSKRFFPHLHTIDQNGHPYCSDDNSYHESFNGVYALMCQACFRLHYFEVNSISFIRQLSLEEPSFLYDLTSSMEVRFMCMCGHEVRSDGNFMDPNIAPIIVALNEKGYWTRFCCEGHPEICGEYTYSSGYIMFVDGKLMSSLINDHPLPENWKVDTLSESEEVYYKDALVIKYVGGHLDPPEIKLEPLKAWIDSLPMRDTDDIILDRHHQMKEKNRSV